MAAQANKKPDGRRKALLAKVHIAISQLGIADEDYRDILQAMFNVRSSAKLSDRNLDKLIRHFESKGFKARGQRSGAGSQVKALKIKARVKLESAVDAGFVRDSRGLVKKICGVDDIEWAGDAVRLKQLLAAIESIVKSGRQA